MASKEEESDSVKYGGKLKRSTERNRVLIYSKITKNDVNSRISKYLWDLSLSSHKKKVTNFIMAQKNYVTSQFVIDFLNTDCQGIV